VAVEPLVEQWLPRVKDAVQCMTSIDELDQTEAVFTAIAKRLKQLGEDAAEAERARILLYIRRGELLDDPKPGNPRPETGRGSTSLASEVDPKSQAEMDRDWLSRTIKTHKTFVVSIIDDMKKPSIRGILREIKRITSRMEACSRHRSGAASATRLGDPVDQKSSLNMKT
jgi:hypothetical protein